MGFIVYLKGLCRTEEIAQHLNYLTWKPEFHPEPMLNVLAHTSNLSSGEVEKLGTLGLDGQALQF